MKYIGTIKPFVEVNAFLESVYMDDNNAYFIHIVEKNCIIRFDVVELTEKDILLADKSFIVSVYDKPIFTFVTGTEKLVYGKYDELLIQFVPFLITESNDSIARALMSSFFRLHGLTVKLLEEYTGPSVINLNVLNFLPFLSNSNPEDIHNLIRSVQIRKSSLQLIQSFFYKDFVYLNHDHLYLDNYRFSFEIIAKYINDETDILYRNIILDLVIDYEIFTQGSYTKKDFLSEKDIFWLIDLVKYRRMARDYKIELPSNVSFDQDSLATTIEPSSARLSHLTENKISIYAAQSKGTVTDRRSYDSMRDQVKNKMQKTV